MLESGYSLQHRIRTVLRWYDEGSVAPALPEYYRSHRSNPLTKISPSAWPLLLQRVAEGKESKADLAKSYRVSERTLRRVIQAARFVVLTGERATLASKGTSQ